MKIHGFDHVEYYVEDLEKAAEGLCGSYGFRLAGRSVASTGPRSVLLRHGHVKMLVTAPGTADDAVAAYLSRHGDGIAMIAFATDDVRQTFDAVVAAGGKGLAAPNFAKSGHERVGTALVGGFSDVTHKLVERTSPDGEFAPGFIEMEPDSRGEAADTVPARGDDPPEPPAELLSELDHVAVCLPAGELDRTVCFYRDVFGLAQIYDERIEVGTQAMASKVVQDQDGLVTFTLIEPDTTREPGQIDDFLRAHDGAGVQHLAFRTPDIATAVRTIAGRGVEFLVAPAGYYQALEGRLGKLAIPLGVLRELNVLADRDRWGQMFQIFARSTHERRTLFFELIERQGALTFGTRNIRALYEALEDTRTGVTH
ncbi:MAG TPA: 4-hydroxyphenylpyruvate dioxygenase [Streptosporangiaceae bacterium]|nr:4-hydroxyphenylpyruvate dioxygenase [Streptosporangiaceae bacterium]